MLNQYWRFRAMLASGLYLLARLRFRFEQLPKQSIESVLLDLHFRLAIAAQLIERFWLDTTRLAVVSSVC
jgi:hypothetical protein